MPVVLPHDLVAALVANGLWPMQLGVVTKDHVREWWNHRVNHAAHMAEHPGSNQKNHEPLYLYGDDACMTKAGNEKMHVCTLSHCLDNRKSSRLTSWPLFLFRCVPCLHAYALHMVQLYIKFAVKTSAGFLVGL